MAEAEKRIIKRYSNRKLYDTRDSSYVTLQQIGEMVRQGEDVQIIDNKTKEDKTEVTLALILSGDLKNKPRSVPLGTLRQLIQERGEKLMSSLREGPLGRLIPIGDEPDGEAEREPPASDVAPITPPVEESDKPKGRFDELRHSIDQFQASLDERVKAALATSSLAASSPAGSASVRELREQVSDLTRRVEALERALAARADRREPLD